MNLHLDKTLNALRYVAVGGLVVGILLLLSVLVQSAGAAAASSGGIDSEPATFDAVVPEDTNAVTNAFVATGRGLATAFAGSEKVMQSGLSGVASAGSATGHGLASAGKASLHAGATGVGAIEHGAAAAIVFGLQVPGAVFETAARVPAVSAVIAPPPPAGSIPTIDPSAPISIASTLKPADASLPEAGAIQPAAAIASAAAKPVPEPTPHWPIHGAITTYFGASDWPFQLHHTGIDISDGARSGITEVHPFKPGKVIRVIHSSVSLGNHVIIDHGGGITSVYGHMYRTAVSEGQMVDDSTVLGTEGSTGASTGPHVHFEVRLNNVAVNPQNYIQGNP